MKAWVVTLITSEGMRVVSLLPPLVDPEAHVASLLYLCCLSLEDQAATFRRDEPFKPLRPNNDNGYVVSVFTEGSNMIHAQKADVLGFREVNGRQWVKWRSVEYTRHALDSEVVIPALEHEAEQVDFRVTSLVPRK